MDVDLKSNLVTLSEVVAAISRGVKAVISTYMARQYQKLKKLQKNAEPQVFLVEDCAQAHGAIVQNRKVGSFGDVGCFSFYPTKNLGGLGDGGAIGFLTNSKDVNTVTTIWLV